MSIECIRIGVIKIFLRYILSFVFSGKEACLSFGGRIRQALRLETVDFVDFEMLFVFVRMGLCLARIPVFIVKTSRAFSILYSQKN